METAKDQEIKPVSEANRNGRSIPKRLIIALVILLLAGTAIFAGLKIFWEKTSHATVEGDKSPTKAKADKVGAMFPLEPFIVNLADSDGKRYLKITMEIELEKENISEELEKRSPQIRDTILTLLTSKSFNDIKDVAGKFKLREQIAKRVNNQLDSGKIRQVYFTEFVIQ